MALNIIRVKEFLLRRGMHQYELARYLGVTESHLSKILRGRAKPSADLTKRISKLVTKA